MTDGPESLVGEQVRLYPAIQGHRTGKLLAISDYEGPQPGKTVYQVQCGNLIFRLVDWRIGSMTDEQFQNEVAAAEEAGAVERPTVYAGKRKSKKAQQAEGESAPAETKAPKEPKVREFKECQCGCGGKTFSLFVPGHDATVKSWLLKVARGQKPKDEVPQIVWNLVASNPKWGGVWQYAQDKAADEAKDKERKAAEKAQRDAEAKGAEAAQGEGGEANAEA